MTETISGLTRSWPTNRRNREGAGGSGPRWDAADSISTQGDHFIERNSGAVLGTYQFPHYSLKIVPEDKHLLAEFANGVTFPIFAESETKFFAKLWPVQFEFSTDDHGQGQSLRDIRVTKRKRALRNNPFHDSRPAGAETTTRSLSNRTKANVWGKASGNASPQARVESDCSISSKSVANGSTASLLFRDTIKIAGAETSQLPHEKGHPLETALNHISTTLL